MIKEEEARKNPASKVVDPSKIRLGNYISGARRRVDIQDPDELLGFRVQVSGVLDVGRNLVTFILH